MKNYLSAAAVLLVIAVVLAAGCSSVQKKAEHSSQEKPTAAAAAKAPEARTAAGTPTPTNSKRLAKNFYEFDKESYDAALKDGKYVFLDFYANWCSTCKSESPAIKAAFNALEDDDVIGFQVNYNDDHTDENEKALAKKFNAPYQHTKLVISPSEAVLSRNYKGPSSEQEILEQIETAIQK